LDAGERGQTIISAFARVRARPVFQDQSYDLTPRHTPRMIRHSRNRRHAYERNADRQRFFVFYQEDQLETLLTSADLIVREGWIRR